MSACRTLRSATVLALSLAATAVSGCASFRAEPEPIVARAEALAAIGKSGAYERITVLTAYERLTTEEERATFRNRVAYIWIEASDAAYDKFIGSLEKEGRGSQFGSNLTVLLLNGIAVISGDEARRALATASATIVGGHSAFTRDVLQNQTVGAIVAEAEARRTRALTEIRRKLVQTSASEYPLGDALGEISRLNRSANLDRASSALTATANAELKSAQEDAREVVGVSIATPDVHAVRVKFSKYVREKADTDTLKKLQELLGAKPDADPTYLKQNIINAYIRRAEGGAAAINALTNELKTITGEEFKL